jgi:hypothetical protein
MNERIDDLYKQARQEAGHANGFDATLQDVYQKFAEMIVQACADELIKWKDEPFPYNPEFGASLIKSLFDVK